MFHIEIGPARWQRKLRAKLAQISELTFFTPTLLSSPLRFSLKLKSHTILPSQTLLLLNQNQKTLSSTNLSLLIPMSPEGKLLDLNNFPEDNTSPGGGGGTLGKDDPGKIYECRFCFLKFCKSQALGGHMNRHRIERGIETLNKARLLVFSNHGAPATHLNFIQSGQGGYPQSIPPPRLASLHPSPPHILSFTSRHAVAPPPGNYYFAGGHALTSSAFGGPPNEAHYGLASGSGGGLQRPENQHGDGCDDGVRDLSLNSGSNYGRR